MALSLGGPAAAADGAWPRATPAEAGFAPDVAERLDARFDKGDFKNLHSVVVARGGKLVFERYYKGPDERWGDSLGEVTFTPELKHDLRSVSKSIVSLLYGIALSEGEAPALDRSLVELFPEYEDLAAEERRRRMTVADALTMRMGTEWNEDLPYTDPRNSEIAMEMAPDRYRFVLDRPMVAEPGTVWAYNGGATAILARLIALGSGKPLFDYAQEKLLRPLGIKDAEWVAGFDGEAAAASGLRLRPRDLARIGQLVLNDGRWDGKQVVPADWLKASFTPRARAFEDVEYGYQWWLGSSRPWISGIGNGGQRLYIAPQFDLVVVVMAGNYNRPDAWKVPVAVIAEVVLPSLRDN